MRWFLLLGRLLFGGLFLWAAARHLLDASTLTAAVAAHSVPYPGAAVLISAMLLALGGASVLLGLAPRLGLGLISLFLIAVTPIMHAFWTVAEPTVRNMELAAFMKNMALLGAAISMIALPLPWPISLDEWIARSGHFGGDLLGHAKRSLKRAIGRVRTRPSMRAGADTHAALVRPLDDTSPHRSWYVSRSWAFRRDGGVVLQNVRAYYRAVDP